MTLTTTKQNPIRFCGQLVSNKQFELIVQIIACYPNLTREELANTVCELLDWTRPNGRLKTVECRQFLEMLENSGHLQLPVRVHTRKNTISIVKIEERDSDQIIKGQLCAFQPISLHLVKSKEARSRWRELVHSYHYLGYRKPFGAHLCYFIYVSTPEPRLAGCLQFSSPAWRMAARDQWIGWNESTRKLHLQRIVNNSRFLLLPWIAVKCLASHAISLAVSRIATDWRKQYRTTPVLLETLVDNSRFKGSCYRASNWVELGSTTGRGRQDRSHQRHGETPKRIFVYPLRKDVCGYLRNQELRSP